VLIRLEGASNDRERLLLVAERERLPRFEQDALQDAKWEENV
jgi:hypothetical protein